MRFIISIFLALFLIKDAVANAYPLFEMYVSVIEKPQVISSREEIDNLVLFAHQHKIKVLYIQVYRANQAWFPSKVGDDGPYRAALLSVGEDPLRRIIDKAHASGIQVHVWVNLLSLAKNVNAPLLEKYGPGILTQSIEKKRSIDDYKIDDQFFMEPGDLRVRAELVDMVGEIFKGYPDIDGIQFDYIRYPDTHPFFGFTEHNLERFKKEHAVDVVKNDLPQWQAWKRMQVTDLLKAVVAKARSLKPGIHISTTGCLGYPRAYDEAFQDWPTWVNSNLVEYVTIMNYPDTVEDFIHHIEDARTRVFDFKRVHVAIGVYKMSNKPETFEQQLSFCRDSLSGGCVFFYYSNFLHTPALMNVLTTNLEGAEHAR